LSSKRQIGTLVPKLMPMFSAVLISSSLA
jgi:hypothetical protein